MDEPQPSVPGSRPEQNEQNHQSEEAGDFVAEEGPAQPLAVCATSGGRPCEIDMSDRFHRQRVAVQKEKNVALFQRSHSRRGLASAFAWPQRTGNPRDNRSDLQATATPSGLWGLLGPLSCRQASSGQCHSLMAQASAIGRYKKNTSSCGPTGYHGRRVERVEREEVGTWGSLERPVDQLGRWYDLLRFQPQLGGSRRSPGRPLSSSSHTLPHAMQRGQ
ncbi:hypothetical protein B0T16DRAFT_17068 [Cercophora newfieldiana]|uniref:Uncharacterized protein n=1 Tax=Cercophora newfieldiana TaxID=92897 RepID=A0AA39YPL4_9PEZI|nr:hypothetical protein B0T16DRAFT_17068 [Cercophora newfieldiana]